MYDTPQAFYENRKNESYEYEVKNVNDEYANILFFKNTDCSNINNVILQNNLTISPRTTALWSLSEGDIDKFLFIIKCRDNYHLRYDTNILYLKYVEGDLDITSICINRLLYLYDNLLCIKRQLNFPFKIFILNILYSGNANKKILTLYLDKINDKIDVLNEIIPDTKALKIKFDKFYNSSYTRNEELKFLEYTFPDVDIPNLISHRRIVDKNIKNLSKLENERFELLNHKNLLKTISNNILDEYTLESLGEILNITRERVRQLLNKYEYELDEFYGDYEFLSQFSLSKKELKALNINNQLYRSCKVDKNSKLYYIDFLSSNLECYNSEYFKYLDENNLIEYNGEHLSKNLKNLLDVYIGSGNFIEGNIVDIINDFTLFCYEFNFQPELVERNFVETLNRNHLIYKGSDSNFICFDINDCLEICEYINDIHTELPNVFSAKIILELLEGRFNTNKISDYAFIHNILKNNYSYDNLQFNRCPHIVKKGCTIETEFYNYKKAHDNYSLEEVVTSFSEMTGILSDTLMSGYSGIVNDEKVSKKEIEDDKIVCYTIIEIENTNYLSKMMKFNKVDNFLIKDNYLNIRDIFDKHTDEKGLMDIRCFSENTQNTIYFKSIILNYCKNFEYLKLDNNYYFKVPDKLMEEFHRFNELTKIILDRELYISKTECVEKILDELPNISSYGFEIDFFEQIYRTNDYIEICHNLLMNKDITFTDFIEEIMRTVEKIEIVDLLEIMQIDYGVKIARMQLLEYINNSNDLVYTSANHYVYKSKEYYIKFIKGSINE